MRHFKKIVKIHRTRDSHAGQGESNRHTDCQDPEPECAIKGNVPSNGQDAGAKNKPHNVASRSKYGLVQVHPDDCSVPDGELQKVDVIAIHGLNGNGFKTWTHENGTFWLAELLPRSLPDARVFSYFYPAEIFLSNSQARISDFALGLLNQLRRSA